MIFPRRHRIRLKKWAGCRALERDTHFLFWSDQNRENTSSNHEGYPPHRRGSERISEFSWFGWNALFWGGIYLQLKSG
jgi:hypothetical protein